jgi:hypothetical protein
MQVGVCDSQVHDVVGDGSCEAKELGALAVEPFDLYMACVLRATIPVLASFVGPATETASAASHAHHSALCHEHLISLCWAEPRNHGRDFAWARYSLEDLSELSVFEVERLQHASVVTRDNPLSLTLLATSWKHLRTSIEA